MAVGWRNRPLAGVALEECDVTGKMLKVSRHVCDQIPVNHNVYEVEVERLLIRMAMLRIDHQNGTSFNAVPVPANVVQSRPGKDD